MLIRNDRDRKGIMRIGRIIDDVLANICSLAVPGMTTMELNLIAGELLKKHGASSTPARESGFPGNLCISVNEEIVHGVPGSRLLRNGDLIKFDLTADKDGYVADAARMTILEPGANSTFALLEAAKAACFAAIDVAAPSVPLKSLGETIQQTVANLGFSVYTDLCGHGVGRRMHEKPEVPNFADSDNGSILREGMVIAIEPLITAGSTNYKRQSDGWTLSTCDGKFSAHYEETVLITNTGAVVVTSK